MTSKPELTPLSKLPFRVRVTLAVLYLAALGLILTANAISIYGGFVAGYTIGLILQFALLYHLMKRA